MVEYQIYRWDSVIIGNNTFPFPMIYIKPEDDFLKMAEKVGGILKLQIKDTDLNYDMKETVGVLNISGFYPNYRPNFFNNTKFYTITLSTNWIGYPVKNGSVTILNLNDIKNSEKEQIILPKTNYAIENYKEEKCNNLSFNQITLICTLLFVFFAIFAIMSLRKFNL